MTRRAAAGHRPEPQPPAADRAGARAAHRRGARAPACTLRFDCRGDGKHGLRPRRRAIVVRRRADATTSSCASCSAATARSSGPAPLRAARASRCSPSTSARSASSRPSSPTSSTRSASSARSRGDFEALPLPAIAIETPAGAAHGDQRRLLSPQGRRARGAARLRRRRRGGRLRALRRPRGLHAGRLDGLQPRQRRPGHGLGRGGLRRVVHRAALADGARARRRARRRADASRTAAARRSTSPSTAARRARSRRAARSPRASCARRAARPGPRLVLLPPPARKFGRLAS